MVPPNSDRVSRAPPYSGYHYSYLLLLIRDYHPLWLTFPGYSNSIRKKYRGPTTPKLPEQLWFRLFPFRSPLLWESLLFSLPPVTEMFQFAGLASCNCLQDNATSSHRVASFGNLRIIRYLLFPVAYRSLSRPSSPLGA